MKNWNAYMHHKPEIRAFFDTKTNTISYVVADPESKQCAIIDSVLDYTLENNLVQYESADAIIAYIHEHQYRVTWILETHVHADHLSAAFYLREKLGGKIAISAHITDVQIIFGDMFGEDETFRRDGSQFDVLFHDSDSFSIGSIPAYALYTPGHTPADMAYVLGDAVFVGDTLFMPDYGSARCDFPGGNATTLHASIQKIFTLPEDMRMFMCHDYLPSGRTEYAWETTVGEQKRDNIHLNEGISVTDFVTMRSHRDATLSAPRLLTPSIQVNMRAGNFQKHPESGLPLLKSLTRSQRQEQSQ